MVTIECIQLLKHMFAANRLEAKIKYVQLQIYVSFKLPTIILNFRHYGNPLDVNLRTEKATRGNKLSRNNSKIKAP